MEALLLCQGIRVNQSQIMKIRVNHRVNQRFGGYFFALFPEKGGKRYGEDHDERAGISIPDGYQPSKGIQAGKSPIASLTDTFSFVIYFVIRHL